MKNKLLFSILFFTAFCVYGQNVWTTVNSGISQGKFLDIDFPTDQIGFVVGHDGTQNFILKTTDGGNSWTNVASSVIDKLIECCDFLDENTGWVAGRDGGIFYTKDGGTTWYKGFSGSNANMTDISFPTEKYGYMCSGQGRFFKSETGGIGWEVNTIDIKDNFVHVKFFTSKKGIIVAHTGHVWKTLDGGQTWDTISKDWTNTLAGYFLEENVGYICGYKGVVKRTVNGGVSWSNATTQDYQNRDWYAIHFFETNHGFVGGEKANILSTVDGGSHWVLEHGDLTGETIYKITTTPVSKVAFAVGTNGLILKRDFPGGVFKKDIDNSFKWFKLDDKLVIHASQKIRKIVVYDINGKILQTFTPENYCFEVTTTKPGIYLVRVFSTEKDYVLKWIN